MVMRFVDGIESRKARAFAVLIALAMVGILITAVVLWASRFDWDKLYGILD